MKLSAIRRVFFAALPLAAALAIIPPAAHAQAAQPAPLEDRRKALNDLFAQYWDATMKLSPEEASSLGDKRYNDKISDYSPRAFNAWIAREQEFLVRLAAIDPTGFSETEKASREILLRDFTDDIESQDFKEWEMPINQLGGIYSTYPQLADQLNFSTVKDYDDWISRLRAIPEAFDQSITNMATGIDDHRVPPRYLLEKALEQVKQLANQKPEDSPLASPIKKFPASIPAAEQDRIKSEILAAVAKRDLPAYQRLARFMEITYIPAGRAEPGISAIPDGAKYYEFLIRRTTTTNLTAAQLHQIGLDEVQRDEAEMLAIAQKLGFKDLAAIRAAVKDNPKFAPASPDALLAAYKNYAVAMQAKLPTLFGRLPKLPFEVVAMPDYLAANGPAAYYEEGAAALNRPGRLSINTSKATTRSLLPVEATAYHEGVPGHHLQISLGQEQENVPEFRRHEGYTAFVEGWALYAERLGKDVGFYQDPYSDYGRLENDIWRAIRLVVDTGVHSQHWSRQQMVDYFHAHSSIDETNLQAETDRYIAWPAQALAYKTGQLKILALRDKAQKALGPKFDIRAFHDTVLDSGALPLDLLEERVNTWIANQSANPTATPK
ncbi:DUF885 domain-containing protein [Terracidiphilus gabretensis]|uniref:DUF885 domain-containing protein n=1 Tax=Terracidiphilus gabretensis TaxID=1577687 RepID=UPI0009E95DA3|nr:DUF885 family protein [Terracidiphilus gabretensis]